MNMYVSNLSFHTTVGRPRELFSKFGEVSSAKIISDKLTNRSRGFGFVEMPSEEEGQEAMKQLNSKEIQGRPLSVTIAREKSNSDRSSFGGGNKRW